MHMVMQPETSFKHVPTTHAPASYPSIHKSYRFKIKNSARIKFPKAN